MRNTLYSLVAVATLSVALFSSAGTRPALAASDAQNRVAWGETMDVLSGSPDNVLVDAAVDAEAQTASDAAASSLIKTMKSGSGGGKRTALAM